MVTPSEPQDRNDAVALTARLLDQLGVAFCLYDEDDRVLLWNEAYLDFFPEQRGHVDRGTPYAETLARFFGRDLSRLEQARIDSHIEAAVARHRTQTEPFVFQRDNGRWLKAASLPWPQGGRLRLWRDVTAEQAGTGDETATPRAVAALDVGYAVFDDRGGYITSNKRYLDLFPQIGGLLVTGTPYPQHLDCIAASLTPVGATTLQPAADRATGAGTGLPLSLPTLLERHDGGWLQLQERVDADGTLVTIWSDATRQVEADARIVRLETYLRDAVDAMPQGLLLFDDEQLVLRNDRLAVVAADLAERMRPGTPLRDFAAWQASLTTPGAGDDAGDGSGNGSEDALLDALRAGLEVEIQRPTRGWLRILSDRTADGYLLLLLTDITAAKEAEAAFRQQREALHQSEKLTALGSLLAGVAHELNNPLSVVVARSLMLEEQVPEGRIGDGIRKIREAAERCGRIVKTFLAMARQRTPARREMDVNEALRGAVKLIGYTLQSSGIEVQLDLAPRLPRILGDSDQLIQVFSNLLVNAEQALAEIGAPRRIVVTSRAVGGDADAGGPSGRSSGVVIRISDNGPGMPEGVRRRIFEPFFTTKPAGTGTGIGLSISRGIVLAHEGTIDVSTEPGRGTTFTVMLPASAEAAEPAPPVERPPPAGRLRRLLVVDDEPEIAETLVEILSNVGHQVDVAHGGRAALDRIREWDYDLIISDLRMPDLDGRGLFERVKVLRPEAAGRFIFLTGDTLSPGADRFLAEVGRPHLQKPVTPQDLRLAVAEAIVATGG